MPRDVTGQVIQVAKGTPAQGEKKKKKRSRRLTSKQMGKYLSGGTGAASAAAAEMRLTHYLTPFLQSGQKLLPEHISVLYDDIIHLEYAYRGWQPGASRGIEFGKYAGHESIMPGGRVSALSPQGKVLQDVLPLSQQRSVVDPTASIVEGPTTKDVTYRGRATPAGTQKRYARSKTVALPLDRPALKAIATKRGKRGGFKRPQVGDVTRESLIRLVPGTTESAANIKRGGQAVGMYADYMALEKGLAGMVIPTAEELYTVWSQEYLASLPKAAAGVGPGMVPPKGKSVPKVSSTVVNETLEQIWKSAQDEVGILTAKRDRMATSLNRILRLPESTWLGHAVAKAGKPVLTKEVSFYTSGRMSKESARGAYVGEILLAEGSATGKPTASQIQRGAAAARELEPAKRKVAMETRLGELRAAGAPQGQRQGPITTRPRAPHPLMSMGATPGEPIIPQGVGQPRPGPQMYDPNVPRPPVGIRPDPSQMGMAVEEAGRRGLLAERAQQITAQHAGMPEPVKGSMPWKAGKGIEKAPNIFQKLMSGGPHQSGVKATSNLKMLLPLLILMGLFGGGMSAMGGERNAA